MDIDQNSLNPSLHLTFLKMSGAGLLDMAQGTEHQHQPHAVPTDTVTAQTLSLCNSTTVFTF